MEISFEDFKAVLDIGTIEGKISIAKPQYLDLRVGNILKERSRALLRLSSAQTFTTEDDPAHDKVGYFSGEAQDSSAAANLDIVGMSTQTK